MIRKDLRPPAVPAVHDPSGSWNTAWPGLAPQSWVAHSNEEPARHTAGLVAGLGSGTQPPQHGILRDHAKGVAGRRRRRRAAGAGCWWWRYGWWP